MVYEIQGRSDYGNIGPYGSRGAYVSSAHSAYTNLVRESRERRSEYGEDSEYARASDPRKFETSIPLSSFPVVRI